ncbi:hypothetical protein HAX54_030451 [Datura stramonium]|uniref:Uncharacterized protein n=1 Tax=Datura stramonium TaxID=4076 RepID=A0ABS8VA18_DATST|nr:hypothetical protein [Datura stramonium]
MKAREHQHQQQLQMQQLQLMQQRNAQLQRRDPNHSPLGGPINAINSSAARMGAAICQCIGNENVRGKNEAPSVHGLETSSALINPIRLHFSNQQLIIKGMLVQGNSGNMSAALQQIQGRPQMATDIKGEVNLGGSQKSLPMDPSSIYGQAILQSKVGLMQFNFLGTPFSIVPFYLSDESVWLNQGVTGLPLKGWPLTGIDQVRPSLGLQVQKPNLQTQNQFLLASQQQQVPAQAQAQGSLGNSPNYGFSGLPRGNFNAKDGQRPKNDGSVCSPVQSNSPKVNSILLESRIDFTENDNVYENVPNAALFVSTGPIAAAAEANCNRPTERKQHSSSGHANSTGTGNTVGPSPSSPASTHTPGDGMTSMSKGLMMYGGEGTGGIASSTNQLDDLEPFGDIGSW